MLNSSNIKLFAIIVSLIILSQNMCYAQFGSCPPPSNLLSCYDADCTSPSSWFTSTKVVYLPDWPNCAITIHYCWRECATTPPGHSLHVYMLGFDFYDGIGDCIALSQYLQDGNPDVASHNVAYVEQQLQLALSKSFFYPIWSTLTPTEKESYRCPTTPSQLDPNANNWRLVTSFVTGSCQGYCRILTSENGTEKVTLVPINCLADYCCKTKIKYCVEDPSVTPPVLRYDRTFDGYVSTSYCSASSNDPNLHCPPGIDATRLPCRSNCQPLTK